MPIPVSEEFRVSGDGIYVDMLGMLSQSGSTKQFIGPVIRFGIFPSALLFQLIRCRPSSFLCCSGLSEIELLRPIYGTWLACNSSS